ncbi:hypothetical protein Bca4012_071299 [Brassica carinata]
MSKRSASSVPLSADESRSRRRVGSPASRSGSSSDTDVTPDCDLTAPVPLTYTTPLSLGPASTVTADDLVEWRDSHTPGEIAVYEAFFEIGFRGVIAALIVGLGDFFEISLSQLNPPAWRILIAIQNLGDLEHISLGINEVLFAYHLAPLNGGEGRLHLRPRSGLTIVEELPRSERKGLVFKKRWAERYAFMSLPGSTYHWNIIAGTHPAPPEGENSVLQARRLPLDRRQVNILVGETVLRCSSLWSKHIFCGFSFSFSAYNRSLCAGNMSGSAADESFAAYQEAAKVMSAKKGSASKTTSGDDVVITGSRCATVVKVEPTSSSQGRKTRGGGAATRASRQLADAGHPVGILVMALSNLNLSVFPKDGTVLPVGSTSEVIQALQGGLLRTASQLYHLKEQLSTEDVSSVREELEAARREALEEKDRRVAIELEIREIKEKIKASEKVAEESSADVLAANRENQKLVEVIDTLKADAENFNLELVMAVNGARVLARWELMREWLKKQSDQWDLAKALDQYKMVMIEEARNKRVAPPSFDDEPAIPPTSEMDVGSSART